MLALGRKAWLLVRSIAAGERAAGFLRLASSNVQDGLDVWAHVKDVLDQILAASTHYHSLLPHIGREACPEFIREYRVQERGDRADRKRRRRALRRLRV